MQDTQNGWTPDTDSLGSSALAFFSDCFTWQKGAEPCANLVEDSGGATS